MSGSQMVICLRNWYWKNWRSTGGICLTFAWSHSRAHPSPRPPPPAPPLPPPKNGEFIYFPPMRWVTFLRESVKCSALTVLTQIANIVQSSFDGDLSGSHHENYGKNPLQINRLERELIPGSKSAAQNSHVTDTRAAITLRRAKTAISSLLRAPDKKPECGEKLQFHMPDVSIWNHFRTFDLTQLNRTQFTRIMASVDKYQGPEGRCAGVPAHSCHCLHLLFDGDLHF